ncbi:MAG: 30S ribosomal protein S20 [Egibacteraceae bacterium]
MANIASQMKRNRQNERARQRNKAVRTNLKTHLRVFRQAAEAGNADAAGEAFKAAARRLDKAASSGVVHENYAANHKSRMARQLQSL